MKLKSLLALVSLMVIALASGGCATIVQGTDQPVKFKVVGSTLPAERAAGKVTYSNGASSGTIDLPRDVSIERSNNPLSLTFEYVGSDQQPHSLPLNIPSSESGWIVGNTGVAIASLGIGLIGFVVDGITNASREYAEEFILDVSTHRVILRYEDDKNHYVYDGESKQFLKTDPQGNPLPDGGGKAEKNRFK